MSECKCDLRTKLVGDGCRYCNPQEYIDHLIECLEEQRIWVALTDEEIDKIYEAHHNQYGECESANFGYERAIESALRNKNYV